MEPSHPRRPIDDLSDQTEMGEPGEAPEVPGKSPDDSSASIDFEGDATLASRVRRRSSGRDRVPARELARGEMVGRYVILEKLGAGSMGVVHAAWDPDLDRKVALKLLHGERHGQRLLREAQAMARLSHPNVITVHDVGEIEGARVFMAMEFVEGHTLAGWARARRREVAEILEVFTGAGRGLAAAHRGGLIHRDFKPDNVMIGNDGRVRVMDFGLVRATGEPDDRSALESSGADLPDALTSSSVLDSRLTIEGSLLGTPAYMAPEQLRGDPADARSDQFGFCVALWECLFDQRPFAGDNPLAVLFAISRAELREPPAARPVPSWIVRVIARGLAADPNKRWRDMDHLLAALADDPRVRVRRWAIGIGSLALTGAAAVAVGLLWPAPAQVVPPCQAVDAPILEIWNEDRAGSLRRQFDASALVYADDSATRVIAELDRWTTQWSEQRRDACEATEVRREQSSDMLDRRMACLDQRLHAVRALVDLFDEADATVIERAVEASENLPRLAPCSDLAWLSAAERTPEDPQLAAAVEQVDRDTAWVIARVDGGKPHDARKLAESTDAYALTLAWPAAQARAALALGYMQQALGEFAEARASLERAFFSARLGNDDEVAVSAATLLVYTFAAGLGDFVLAQAWLDHAEAEADRLGRPELRAGVDASEGIYWYMHDQIPEAAQAFARSLELYERGGAGSVQLGMAHVNYGSVLIRVDERLYAREAVSKTERGIELLTRGLGPNHPQLGLALGNLATVYGYLGRTDDAIARLEQSLDILERVYGPDHPHVGLSELNLATNLFLAKSGQLPRALELAEDSLRIHETMGSEHQMTAESLRAIARIHREAGRPADALVALDRALAIWTKLGMPAIGAHYLRVLCLLDLDRLADADAEIQRIRERFAGSPGRLDEIDVILTILSRLLELQSAAQSAPQSAHELAGLRARIPELLVDGRLAVQRTGNTRLQAILGQLELEYSGG